MPTAERAKQFLPFAALNGLVEALERQENDVEKESEPEARDEELRVES